MSGYNVRSEIQRDKIGLACRTFTVTDRFTRYAGHGVDVTDPFRAIEGAVNSETVRMSTSATALSDAMEWNMEVRVMAHSVDTAGRDYHQHYQTKHVLLTEDMISIPDNILGVGSTVTNIVNGDGYVLRYMAPTRHVGNAEVEHIFVVVPVEGHTGAISGVIKTATATLTVDTFTPTYGTSDCAGYEIDVDHSDSAAFTLVRLNTPEGTKSAVLIAFPWEYTGENLLNGADGEEFQLDNRMVPGLYALSVDFDIDMRYDSFVNEIQTVDTEGSLVTAADVAALNTALDTAIAASDSDKSSIISILKGVVRGEYSTLPDLLNDVDDVISIDSILVTLGMRAATLPAPWNVVVGGILAVTGIGLEIARNSGSRVGSETDASAMEASAHGISLLNKLRYASFNDLSISSLTNSLSAFKNALASPIDEHHDKYMVIYTPSVGKLASSLFAEGLRFFSNSDAQGISMSFMMLVYFPGDSIRKVYVMNFADPEDMVIEDKYRIVTSTFVQGLNVDTGTYVNTVPDHINNYIRKNKLKVLFKTHVAINELMLQNFLNLVENGFNYNSISSALNDVASSIVDFITRGDIPLSPMFDPYRRDMLTVVE
jgi:hypothetical protein